MDHVYPTKDYKEYIIKDSMNELREVVLSSDLPDSFEKITECLQLADEDELRKKSLELCQIYEDYGKDRPCASGDVFQDLPENAFELNCMKYLQKQNVPFKEPRSRESHLISKKKEVDENADIEPFKDCVLTIRFYEPFKYTPCIKNHPRFHMEYKVLGSSYLTQLRDMFYCSCNFGPFLDISEYPQASIVQEENAPNPGFFFIHDTFYNDTRNEKNLDYSACIRKYMSKLHYAREFRTASMEATKFEDIKLRIGYPNVYQHYGACEHIFCITSVDLIDSSDSLSSAAYPKLSLISNKRMILCDICNKAEAEFIVTNCPLHVKDPTRLCDNCFFSFHYIEKSTKTCEFNAYRLYSINPRNAENVLEQIEEYEIYSAS